MPLSALEMAASGKHPAVNRSVVLHFVDAGVNGLSAVALWTVRIAAGIAVGAVIRSLHSVLPPNHCLVGGILLAAVRMAVRRGPPRPSAWQSEIRLQTPAPHGTAPAR